MNNLTIINHNDQRILTTSQIAEAYGTDEKIISNNFNRNKERYIESKHFYCLEGDQLKEFKANHQIDEQLKFATKLYLWTEKGALLHAKSLGTDKAWQVYEELVETYFEVKQQQVQNLSPQLQLLINMELEQKKQQQQLNQINHHALEAKAQAEEVKQEIQDIRNVITLDHSQWRDEITRIVVSIAHKFGGNQYIQDVWKEGYALLEQRGKTKLEIRLNNRRKNILAETGSKAKANKYTKLDVIGEEAKLRETFIAIVKEMAIKYGVA